MTDRFDLEQQIMDCWRVVDDLKLLSEEIIENDLDLTLENANFTDKLSNLTIGMEAMYQLKFEKLFRTFEELIRSGAIGSPDYSGDMEWDSRDDDISF